MSCAHCREMFLFAEVGPAASRTLPPGKTDRVNFFADIEIEFKKSQKDLSPKKRAFRMDSVGLAAERSRPRNVGLEKIARSMRYRKTADHLESPGGGEADSIAKKMERLFGQRHRRDQANH